MSDDSRPVDYSIVIPVYFNEGSLHTTLQSLLREVIEPCRPLRAEVIFVDDGSGDHSFRELTELRAQHPSLVRVVKLTRNFGQAAAMLAGFARARGRCVVNLSADGQDPAALVRQMLDAHLQEGFEVVICTRTSRDESWYRILTSKIFYAITRKLSFPNMPSGGFDFVLMGRRALTAFLRNADAHYFFQGLILWTGFPHKLIPYERRRREVGRSRWTFGKKLTYLIDGVMSYSFLPIRFVSAAGFFVALLGFLYAAIILVARLIGDVPIKGWAPLMVILLVLGGIQMLMLGILGEYVWRTLAQARRREPYVIEQVLGETDETEAVPPAGSARS